MSFTVLIPARLASTRLPEKALADIAGQPMIVRVARRAALSGAGRVLVATDSLEIVQACQAAQVEAVITRADHVCGTDRLAQVVQDLAFADDEIVVNVQGDEPLISPDLINACAQTLQQNLQASMSTAAHAIDKAADVFNPNVVKVVLDAQNFALYFSRAPIAWWRDGWKDGAQTLPTPGPLRHIGIYGYRAGFLRSFPQLAPAPMEQLEALEQLRALWHGHRIVVHVADQSTGVGVDTAEDLARVRQAFERQG